MSHISKMLIGAAGLAALVGVASPAMAQSYPYGYPQQQQQQGVLGAIINSVTGGGYGQYPQGNYGYGRVNERAAVSQCAAAAEQRINGSYRGQQGYGYNGYNQGYQNGYGQARVLGITNVERRNNGSLRVTGVATSGQAYGGYQNGYNGYQNGYQAQQQADLRFTCRVNLRGQVSDLKINRGNVAYRGY
jgi:hypothetical protein